MQNRTPSDRPVLDFTPVPRRHARVDGWTAERQRGFIAALAATGSVRAAAKRVNMAPEGAYQLRLAAGADSFRIAWDTALDHGVQNLRDIAIERATEGVVEPVWSRGEIVGEKRVYNDRLLMFTINHANGGPNGIGRGTKSQQRLAQEEAAAAEPPPVEVVKNTMIEKLREMAERMYETATDAELAAQSDEMSVAEILALQMFPRPGKGLKLGEPQGRLAAVLMANRPAAPKPTYPEYPPDCVFPYPCKCSWCSKAEDEADG